jgi:hypothetical protein
MNRLLGVAVIAVAIMALPGDSRAAFIIYTTNLSGANEVPAVTTPGTGFAEVDVDTTANTMRVRVTFSGLTANTTMSHIHAAAPPGSNAGVATTTPTFPNFPLGVTSGTYDMTFDMTLASSYNPAFITANGGTAASAEAALFAALASDQAYLNIHTTTNTGGEIRGWLTPAAVPEPSSFVLGGLCALGLAVFARRRPARRPA